MSDKGVGDLLRSRGFRATRGRMNLLSALMSARRPLIQAQILRRLRGTGFDRVSLYRALEALVGAGLIHRAYMGARTWAYETADHCGERLCHPHFTCRKCGTVSCLTGTMAPLARGLPKGYIIERQRVHIDGICGPCAEQSRRTGKRS